MQKSYCIFCFRTQYRDTCYFANEIIVVRYDWLCLSIFELETGELGYESVVL